MTLFRNKNKRNKLKQPFDWDAIPITEYNQSNVHPIFICNFIFYNYIFCAKSCFPFLFSDLKDNNNDDDSDNEKGSDDKGLELSSDSELSLGDEPLMEIQVSFYSFFHSLSPKNNITNNGVKSKE